MFMKVPFHIKYARSPKVGRTIFNNILMPMQLHVYQAMDRVTPGSSMQQYRLTLNDA